MEGISSDCEGIGGPVSASAFASAPGAGLSSGGSSFLSETRDSSEGARVGAFRLAGMEVGAFDALVKPEFGRSLSESVLSSSSSGIVAGRLRLAAGGGGGFFAAGLGLGLGLVVVCDDVEGLRGRVEGFRGLKAGTLLFDAAYITCSLGSLRMGILIVGFGRRVTRRA